MSPMLPFTFTAPSFKDGKYGTLEVRAMRTECPHILITEAFEWCGAYRLTHADTGMTLTYGDTGASRDAFGLFALAAELGKIGDWSRPARDLVADKEFAAAVPRVIKASSIKWLQYENSPEHTEASRAALAPRGNA